MKKDLLNKLKKHTNTPCISLIVSTKYKSFLDREEIRLKLKNNVSEIKTELKNTEYEDSIIQKIIGSVMNLIEQADFSHLQKGIGIYVSPDFNEFVSFPFSVEDKVNVGDHFLTSEIEKLTDKKFRYSILLLSKSKSRFFEGVENTIREIKDENFPLSFENQFEVNRTSPHSFYNNEESKIDQVRAENYFRKIDKLIQNEYDKHPIFLLGVVENLSLFKSIHKNDNEILEEIKGNFDKHTLHEIEPLILPIVEQYIEKVDA